MMFVPAAAGMLLGRVRHFRLGRRLFPTIFAATVNRVSVAFNAARCRFFHRLTANSVSLQSARSTGTAAAQSEPHQRRDARRLILMDELHSALGTTAAAVLDNLWVHRASVFVDVSAAMFV